MTKPLPTVGEYLNQRDIRANLPGRITNGTMFVFFNNEWIEDSEFKKIWPPIVIPNFGHDPNNCDTRKLWIYQ